MIGYEGNLRVHDTSTKLREDDIFIAMMSELVKGRSIQRHTTIYSETTISSLKSSVFEVYIFILRHKVHSLMRVLINITSTDDMTKWNNSFHLGTCILILSFHIFSLLSQPGIFFSK